MLRNPCSVAETRLETWGCKKTDQDFNAQIIIGDSNNAQYQFKTATIDGEKRDHSHVKTMQMLHLLLTLIIL